jgi:predicted Zn-dependent protease
MYIDRIITYLTRFSLVHSFYVSVALAGALVSSQVSAAAVAKLPAAVEVAASDIERARTYYAEILKTTPLYADEKTQQYVASIGMRLAAIAPRTNVQYQFAVLDSEGVFAYSLAGGQIVISRGMLAYLNSEAELAAVFGHEIGHVAGLHQGRIWQQVARAIDLESKLESRFSSDQAREMLGTLSLARVRGYGREQEVEADAWGEQLLKKAGYDPIAAARMLMFLVQYDAYVEATGFRMWDLPDNDMSGAGVFATHPSSIARLELALKRQHATKLSAVPPDTAYLDKLKGLHFGVPERFGIQRESLFVHASHRVAFTLPTAWYAFGHREEVVAASADNDAIVHIQLETRTRDESLRDALKRIARFEKVKFEPLAGNAAKGEMATILADDGSQKGLYAAIDVGGQRVYCRGVARSAEAWANNQDRVLAVIRSLHVPSAMEATIEPLRIAVEQTSNAGELAPAAVFPVHARENTEILNQLFPNGGVEAGRWIKVVR